MNQLLQIDKAAAWDNRVEADRAPTVLLVEDEAFVRDATQEILEAAGYRVLAAGDSVQASRLYNQFGAEVDLLLTDMILPGENGRELAGRMRQQNPELGVLLATGYADQIAVLKNSGEEYLLKPFCSEDLLKKVAEMMAGSTGQPEQGLMRACAGA